MQVTTFLMFTGQADEAMQEYITTFPRSSIVSVERYKAGEPGAEGTVKLALFELDGTRLMCIDSPAKHAFTFTPSMSLFIDFEQRADLDHAYDRLSRDGQILMPPDNYGFSTRFTWVQDRFGVSWQLNLK